MKPLPLEPPSLPKSEADLAPWHVYADELLTRGHPLGELIAADLALPVKPDPRALTSFRRQAQQAWRRSERLLIGWCLGFAQTLELSSERPDRLITGVTSLLDEGVLNAARDFLRSPQGQRVEELIVHLAPREGCKRWRALMGSLPSTCVTVTLPDLERIRLQAGGLARVLGSLPPTVRTLRIGEEPQTALTGVDRFAACELLGPSLSRTFLEGSARGRLKVGSPGDAALWGEGVTLLRRWPLTTLQHHYGPISALTAILRALPERYGLKRGRPPGVGRGQHLVRHSDGSWTALAAQMDPTERPSVIAVNGRELSAKDPPTPLVAGDSVEIDGQPMRFVTDLSAAPFVAP